MFCDFPPILSDAMTSSSHAPESQTGQDKNSQVRKRQRLPPEQTQRTAQRTAGADGEKEL